MRPHYFIVSLFLCAVIVAAWLVLPGASPNRQTALFYQSEFVSVPDGTLIRAAGDEQVYYAVADHKRWIDSAETFRAQGFREDDIRTVTAQELARYPDGEPITTFTHLVLPKEQKILPDLAPLAPYQLRMATVGKRMVIRFTGAFWNGGYQPLELLSQNQVGSGAGGTEDVYQHVLAEDGTDRKKFVGTFVWHPAHKHHHFNDFAEYLFEPAQLVPGTKMLTPSIRQKTTFCMRDDERMPADIPNSPQKPAFTNCGPQGQGVSAGWMDVYKYSLPDQFIDVQDMQPGVYALSFSIDPNKLLIDEHDDNNIGTTLIQLDVKHKSLRIIATLNPFPTLRNHVEDGTLLRDASSGYVYVIQNDHKRWLRSTDVFSAYGYDWDSVYPVTKAMAAAIPSQQLIRRQNTSEVYIVNEDGYARHILNPDIFASYGFKPEDIVDISDLDFTSYGRSDLIMRSGDTQVYSISGATKHPVGTLSSLQASLPVTGRNLNGLQLVNQVDFDAYASN